MCVDVWVYMHGYGQAPRHQLSFLLARKASLLYPTKPERSKYFEYQQNILYFPFKL